MGISNPFKYRLMCWLIALLLMPVVLATPGFSDELAACRDKGDRSLAIAACTRLIPTISDRKQLALTYILRANAYEDKGDNQAAIRDRTTAIEIRAESLDYLGRGLLYHRMTEYGRALADFNTALAKARNESFMRTHILFTRAQTYEAQGRISDAIIDYRAALASDLPSTSQGATDALKRLGVTP